MTNREFEIFCVNDGKNYKAEYGMTLAALLEKTGISKGNNLNDTVFAALVDNELKQLSHSLGITRKVEFLTFLHPDGRRCYIRSLCFILQNAIRELYPDKILVIDHSLPAGLYCEIRETTHDESGRRPIHFVTNSDMEKIKAAMKKLVDRDLPFTKEHASIDDAEKIFIANNQKHKAELFRSLGRYFCSIYWLDGQADSFHGPLVPSTGYLKTFDLMGIGAGFCLRYPSVDDPETVLPMVPQSKIAATLKEYSTWCEIIGVNGIGSLNKSILDGEAIKIINLCEALHERNYAAIADQIYARRKDVRIVFIAGPSSSGKTSSSLRIACQCKVLGLNPKVIELDNYFVDREKTPKDENGEYDFEALEAMDLKLLNRQLNELLEGKEVEIPKYDFKAGRGSPSGKKMVLGEKDILIMEGIHALDPAMVPDVDQSRIFRVYASALTSLNVDENNNISTSDNRLLRRIIRDNRTRGITPENTILRWNSVRRGENRNIFPFQENADVFFNSALLYELPMLKYFAEPLLRRISPTSPAYCEAFRLLKFLDFIVALSPAEIQAIPPTSIMREFIGGQTL